MISTNSFADFFARNRIALAVTVVAITALATWGQFRPAPSRGKLGQRELEPDDRLLKEVGEQFDVRRTECFLVVESDDLFTPAAVAGMRAIAEDVENLDYVDRVVSLDNLPVLNAFGLPEPMLPREGATDASFREARGRVLEHPLAVGQLVAPDGKTLLMPVTFDWLNVTSDADCSSRLLDVARNAAAKFPDAGLQVRLTGSVPIFLAQDAAFERNNRKFRIIGYLLTGIIAIVLFRGLTAVIIVAAAPALAIFWSGGLIQLLGIPRNDLTNAVLPVLVTMVGMTDGVHLMVFIRRLRAEGRTPLDATCETIRRVGLACLLTSLTTAIGFCSLLLADSRFIRDFGVACAVGVAVSFVAVITIIPLACSIPLARNVHRGHEHDLVGKGLKHFGGVIDWIIAHRVLVTVVAFGATIVCATTALQLRPDARRSFVLPSESEAARALEHCDRAFGGIEFARVVVQWPGDVPSNSPAILESIRDVEKVLADEPLLRHPLSIRNIVDLFPGDATSAAARMSFLELMPPELRRLLYNPQQRRTLVTVRVQDIGLAKYTPVFERVEQRLHDLEARHTGFQFELTGDVVVGGRDLNQIVYDLAASLGTASVIIFLVIALVYRSARIGLITVIPNIFPLALTAAVLVLVGSSLTVVTVCAFTICIGIAVDDTIHFLTRFQHEMSAGGDVGAAIHRSFIGVGNAMVMTTIILITGFASVLLSELPAHRTFAAMACSTIAAALIGDLIFFPAMLACFSRRDDGRDEDEAAKSEAIEVELGGRSSC